MALEWLLRLPQQRCRLTEIRDLLDVPAVAQRFGLQTEDLPRLSQWMEGAGIRWGLNPEQRSELGLGACGEQNTWLFGLRRMLMGYASGDGRQTVGPSAASRSGAAFNEIQPYAEVGGLEASIAGSLAGVVDALVRWWAQASAPAAPAQWAERGRQLIEDFIAPTDDRERMTVAALQDTMRAWLEACDAAGFDEPVSLSVACEAWLSGIDEPALTSRFRAGGVTFCTLLPMRAIPFEVVCLMGMNDGDYPRSSSRSDFDLMGLPGHQRPGDRSRRDDDRQLMLEALLSARRVLYVSWTGRSARDNSEQPPSVLVSQLRDYLASGWRGDVLSARTTQHPLQPFSRRYFEVQDEAPQQGERLFTHAREWRAAHALPSSIAVAAASTRFEADPSVLLTVAALARFLKNPVRDFFRLRLDVVFRDGDDAADDDEPFALDGLQEYGLLDEVINDVLVEVNGSAPDLRRLVAEHVARIHRAGRLPMAEQGRRTEHALVETLVPMLQRWREVRALYPQTSHKEPLRFEHEAGVLNDWLDGLQAPQEEPGLRVWLELTPGKLCDRRKAVRPDKLITAWVRTIAAGACGRPVQGVIVGRDATVTVKPMPADEAVTALTTLMQAWREGMTAPLPLASRTALALVGGASDVAAVYEGSQFPRGGSPGEGEEACLSRMYPDYETLCADGRFHVLASRLFDPVVQWINAHVTWELHAVPDLKQPIPVTAANTDAQLEVSTHE